MKTNSKLRAFLSILVVLSFLYPVFTAPAETIGRSKKARVKELIKKADRISRKARLEERTEEKLRDAIDAYRRVIEIDPDNRHALNRLSLGYFSLAEAYLDGSKKKEDTYRRGYNYGIESLKVNKDFAELYEKNGNKALKKLPDTVEDVEAIFWTGANLGRLGETKGVLDSLGDLPALVELNRRTLNLNEAYLGGAAHRALGSIAGELLSRQPITFLIVHNNGFSWKKVKAHFERALEIAPNCLENHFSYAKYYALKKGKKDFARELIEEVLSRSLGDEFPLINKIAKEKAKELKMRIFD